MRRILFAIVAALSISIAISAAVKASDETDEVVTTTQKWTPGWDNFHEPLNYEKSKLSWSVNGSARTMTITYTMVGARPNKLYQTALHIFCDTFPADFGQFPTIVYTNHDCISYTRQGETKTSAGVFIGVVTTDIHGDGTFTTTVGPIEPGTYHMEFWLRDGAGGCEGNQGSDFQSPGPDWGDATKVVIP
jgi:hypothetical protein